VADYILKHLDILNTKTLSQMSKTVHVGEATIMRFIYKLGYENLAQFKVAIIQENLINDKKLIKTYANELNKTIKEKFSWENTAKKILKDMEVVQDE